MKLDKEELIGKKVYIYKMNGEEQYNDKEGIITFVDDWGQIHGTWGGCAIIPEVDTFEIVEEETWNIKTLLEQEKAKTNENNNR